MPLIEPQNGETQEGFIARFMSDNAMQREYPQEQRLAIAYHVWAEQGRKKYDMAGGIMAGSGSNTYVPGVSPAKKKDRLP